MDGRVAECVVCVGSWDGKAIVASRAKDISFVLDQLLVRYKGMIDPTRIAAHCRTYGAVGTARSPSLDRRSSSKARISGANALARNRSRTG